MTQFLPANLLALFAPRDPIPYLPPADKLPHEKKTRGYSGVGAFLDQFEVNINNLLDLYMLLIYFLTGSQRHTATNSSRDKRRAFRA